MKLDVLFNPNEPNAIAVKFDSGIRNFVPMAHLQESRKEVERLRRENALLRNKLSAEGEAHV